MTWTTFPAQLIWIVVLGVPVSLYGNRMFDRMLREVNHKLPPDQQISAYFWHYDKYRKVTTLHKQFYPTSRTRQVVNAIEVVGAATFVYMIWVLFRLP